MPLASKGVVLCRATLRWPGRVAARKWGLEQVTNFRDFHYWA